MHRFAIPSTPELSDSGFSGSLRPGTRPAVLSVDFMKSYFSQDSLFQLPDASCLRTAASVIAAARAHAVPVIHTRIEYSHHALEGGLFIQKVPALNELVGANEMNDLMPDVYPDEKEIILTKQYASAFFGTGLSSLLRTMQIDTVVIIGVSTSGCIRASAVDAMQHGLVPLVVGDGVADRNQTVHNASLYDLQAKYAEVLKTSSILGYLASIN